MEIFLVSTRVDRSVQNARRKRERAIKAKNGRRRKERARKAMTWMLILITDFAFNRVWGMSNGIEFLADRMFSGGSAKNLCFLLSSWTFIPFILTHSNELFSRRNSFQSSNQLILQFIACIKNNFHWIFPPIQTNYVEAVAFVKVFIENFVEKC